VPPAPNGMEEPGWATLELGEPGWATLELRGHGWANLGNPRAEAACFSQVDGCSAHVEKETQLGGVCYAGHGSTAMTA